MSVSITYNGHKLTNFVPQITSAYVSKRDWHATELPLIEKKKRLNFDVVDAYIVGSATAQIIVTNLKYANVSL
jgi:hypothetical protein